MSSNLGFASLQLQIQPQYNNNNTGAAMMLSDMTRPHELIHGYMNSATIWLHVESAQLRHEQRPDQEVPI